MNVLIKILIKLRLSNYLQNLLKLRISMLNEVEANLQFDLKRGKICTLYSYNQRFPNISPSKIAQLFMNLYKSDAVMTFELLCHIVINKDEGMRIQLQKFENIKKGMVLNYTSGMEPLTFQKENVKELKIIAIFPEQLSIDEVKRSVEFPQMKKTKKYANRFLMAPIIKLNKDMPAVENPSKKEQPKKEVKPQVKQPIKVVKKDEKANLVKKQPIQQKIQLPRVTNKQQKPVSILTEFIAMREKVQNIKAKVENEKQKNKNKMVIQSDEELYDKKEFNKMMEQEPERDTDTSGKKSNIQESAKKPEPMEIQTEKPLAVEEKKFIEDDEDDAEDVFNQIQLVEKKKMEKPLPEAPKIIKEPIIAEKPKVINVQPMKPKQSNKPPSQPKPASKMYPMFNFLPRTKNNS